MFRHHPGAIDEAGLRGRRTGAALSEARVITTKPWPHRQAEQVPGASELVGEERRFMVLPSTGMDAHQEVAEDDGRPAVKARLTAM